MTDAPPIRFELRFAGSSCADAAAETRERGVRPHETRHQVLELGELDLELAFARLRATREDVEDQLRAIDDLAIEDAFEVAQLRGAQLVVEDHDVGPDLVARCRE